MWVGDAGAAPYGFKGAGFSSIRNPLRRGDGRRVQKSSGTLYWYGMGSDPITETDSSGNVTNEYVFFGGKRIARRDSSGNIFYYLEDHLGTSRVIVQSGQTSACYEVDFYPFGGERTPITNTCSQNYKFTGKERDSESGLDDFDARYYSSSFGRFTSPDWSARAEDIPYADPTDPQTLNLYSYVRDIPTTRVDPNGHQDEQPAWKQFAQAMRNLISIKVESGAGVKLSGSIAGLKVGGGSGTTTETKIYPLGDRPSRVTTKAESSVEIKVGSVKGELKSSAPHLDPESGKIDKGGSSAGAGIGSEHTKGLFISADKEISVIGVSVGVGPLKAGAEVVVNVPELKQAARTFGSAVMEGIGYLTGFGSPVQSTTTSSAPTSPQIKKPD